MKSNKKVFKRKVKKLIKEEKKVVVPKIYTETIPRFEIGDLVLYFMDTSTLVESGVIVGIFVQPGADKDYVYQVEYEFKDDKKKKHKGMCVPKSENVLGVNDKNAKENLAKKLTKINVNKLNVEIKEYKDSLKMADDNIKQQNKYKVDTSKIIDDLEKRKLEILNNSKLSTCKK